jgi:hypothetical protein
MNYSLDRLKIFLVLVEKTTIQLESKRGLKS